MLGSIFTALSGMNAFSQGLQTISNNVANLNSLGFKAQKVTFTDMYNQSGNGGGLSYSADAGKVAGSGVRFADPITDFNQGNLQASSGPLDLAIQGVGFLTLKNGAETLYTRTGQFAVDKDGYVTLQGTDYRLSILDAANQPVAANVDANRTNSPVATTTASFTNNLSSAATSANININVYDASGKQHAWNVSFAPVGSASPNQWTVTVKDETGATLKTATVGFNAGVADPATAKFTVDASPAGSAAMSVQLDFSGVTSFSSGTTSTIAAAKVDGHATGDLNSVTVDNDGQLLLTYSSGEKVKLGAVALADFRDPQQLTQVGNNLYEYSGVGQFRYLASGAGGIGTIQGKQLEASNVNLTNEFGQLILVQRGFQASSQVVSVSNDMIQQLFGMRGQG